MASLKTPEELKKLFAELEPLRPMQGTEYLVSVFNQLSARRSMGMSGPQPLSFQELDAFNKLTEADLSPWEVQTICAMDGVYLNETYALMDSKAA